MPGDEEEEEGEEDEEENEEEEEEDLSGEVAGKRDSKCCIHVVRPT